MPGFAGLRTDFLTWVIMAGLTACWMLSLRLVPNWKRDGWTALLQSLYGFVWLGFGVDVVLRFLMLSYNAVEWGNSSLRLVAQPVDTVNLTLEYCALFWVMTALSYAVAVRRHGPGPLVLARAFTVDFVYAVAIPTAVLCSALFYLTDGQTAVPVELVTPLSAFAYLYIVPATIIWWDHFRRPGPNWQIGGVCLLALLPALVHAWRSPYRENTAPLFLIPLVAAVFAGRRPTLRKLVPAVLIWFLVISSLISSYRRIKWENARPEQVANEIRSAGAVEWITGSWGERMARFHSFDSMLLTIHLVPTARPYSGRNVLVNPFVRGFVPRFIYGAKGEADASEKFGSSIWSYDDPTARDHGGAAIAPSMPGDLYEAGGVLYIALGALIWGMLLGLVDGWKGHLPPYCSAAITVLVATHCAMSVERDFDHSVAAFIQIFLLLIVVAGLVAMVRPAGADYSLGLNPGLERT